MVAGTANLACQPAHAALVGFELCPNQLPYVDAMVFHRLPLVLRLFFQQAMKKREKLFLMSPKALEGPSHHK